MKKVPRKDSLFFDKRVQPMSPLDSNHSLQQIEYKVLR